MESGPQGGEVTLELVVRVANELTDLDADPDLEIRDPDDVVVATGVGSHLTTGRYRFTRTIGATDEPSADWAIVWTGEVTVDGETSPVSATENFEVTVGPPIIVAPPGVPFLGMLERTVTIVPRVLDGTDAHGNEIRIDGDPVPSVPAARDLRSATEEERGRDEQERVYLYVLPAALTDGTPISVTGYDRLIDVDGTFEVRGTPAVAVRRRDRTAHHLEVVAYKIDG